MKIILIAPSYSPEVNTLYFPLGLSYVGAYAKSQGYNVDGINLNHMSDPDRYNLLRTRISDNDYDVIGIGGLTICFNEIEKLIELIRETVPNTPIVLGGGITSCEAELVMRTLKPDFMVVGEGEEIFTNLLHAIQENVTLNSVSGIWYWKHNKPIYTGKGDEIDNLDVLPLPDLDMMDIRRHLALQGDRQESYHLTRYDMGRAMPMIASRSCPFHCTFCHHAGMGSYRTINIDIVIGQIEHYIDKYGIHSFYIYDELFSADKNRLQRFCKLIMKKGISLQWFCQLRVDQLDQESLHLMKKAGCNFISLGFESGSDTVLKSMQKKITTSEIAIAVQMLREEAKIGFQANFLFGDPAETNETIEESLCFQQQNQLYFVDWSAVIPYTGTQLFDYANKRGLIKDKLKLIRSQCDISHYLYNDHVNMTSMSDKQFHSWYIKLREINDLNHRKRLTDVGGKVAKGEWQSYLTLKCPSCGYSFNTTFRYPAEAETSGNINLNSPIGMQGVNFLCPECCRKMHLLPKDIPHIKPFFTNFQRRIDAVRNSRLPVVLLPAMDRYFSVFSEDIALAGLNLVNVLDSRKFRIGNIFLGQTINSLNKENIKKHSDAIFIILPWIEYKKAEVLIIDAGVPPQMVLSWNHFFESAAKNKSEYRKSKHSTNTNIYTG